MDEDEDFGHRPRSHDRSHWVCVPARGRSDWAGMSKPFYITTAIDYLNGQPHLGHGYEKVITDVIARAAPRSLGEEVFFLTGTDEHGQKVQQAAAADGKEPQQYCDELAANFQALATSLNLSNNEFIRTTQPRHKAVVAALLNHLHARGEIYKAPYRGWYSWKEESFLTDKDRRPDGSFDPFWGEVKELVEDNWYLPDGTTPGVAGRIPRGAPGVRPAGLSPQRGAGLPARRDARRPRISRPRARPQAGDPAAL